MKDEILFDYKQYIEERLREIDDLDERRYAKQVIMTGLAGIFEASEKRYRQLEERISQELETPWNSCEIVTTAIAIRQYDPIHETLFPVCREDTEGSGSENGGVNTVYLAADDAACREFLEEGVITGIVDGQEVSFKITRSGRYEEALKKIYSLFLSNQITWHTVHTGHLERFFDLEPLEADCGSAVFQWGKWEPYIRVNMLPLWNIRESVLESHRFAFPCLDGICYEHAFTIKDREEGTFLIDSEADIMGIRYEQGKIILTSRSEILKRVGTYQLCSVAGMELPPQSYLPILTNRRAGSFAARYLHKTGHFLQTEAELFRKVTELSKGCPVRLVRYEILDKTKMPLLYADMNSFIKGEVFPREKRKILVLFFEGGEEDYLCQSHIRYLLSQMQLAYIEYKCVGTMV